MMKLLERLEDLVLYSERRFIAGFILAGIIVGLWVLAVLLVPAAA